jgi:hypothetical protein
MATASQRTDWTDIYCRIASLGLSDPLFHASNFRRTPTRLVVALLNHQTKDRKQTINAQSISTAKLGMVVIGALAGKKAKASISDFLPFESEADSTGMQPSTIEALKWALKNEKLPPVIVGLIGIELA